MAAGWQFDRHIPIVVMVGFLANAAGGVWYASQFEARLGQVERVQTEERAENNVELKHLEAAREETALKIAHIDDTVTSIREAVNQLNNIRR